jgi:16S rRNA (guanine527-N7)-methyltransferase
LSATGAKNKARPAPADLTSDGSQTFADAIRAHAALFSSLGVAPGSTVEKNIAVYLELLAHWNNTHKLISYRSIEELALFHIADSLKALEFLPPEAPAAARALDVGSGGGLPGIPLALARPSWQMTLLDSIDKKVAALRDIVEKIPAPHVSAMTGRAEALGHDPEHREAYDFVFCRAVGRFTEALELTTPFLKYGGTALLHRGREAIQEIQAAEQALEELGCESAGVYAYTLPGLEHPRHIAVIEKTAPTPDNYPRRTGVPSKRPL